MRRKKLIFTVVGLVVLGIFFLSTLIYTSQQRKKLVCSVINVEYKQDNEFISKGFVKKLILSKMPKLIGSRLDKIDTNPIEDILEKCPWVKKAEAFKTYERADGKIRGVLRVSIDQREPVLRVSIGDDGYYVDNDGETFPLSILYSPQVIVANGSIGKQFATTKLFELAKYINNDKLLKALIQQIYVKRNGEILLVPRIGGHLVEFGETDNMEQKFKLLLAVYDQGLSEGRWNKYKMISIKYSNQIVCTLK